MQLAIDVPNFGPYADPHTISRLAAEVEECGWDGLSLWDHILYFSGNPVGDPFVLLTAAAAATDRIRLFSLVTPVPRRRPWVLARQCVTLDQYSGGRLVLGVGIGEPPEPEFGAFGEPTDARLRADMLDEGLDVITGMWSGEPFAFHGEHYSIAEHAFQPTPTQQPRVPIWVAGAWPNKRPFRRAARFDGVAPIKLGGEGYELLDVDDIAEICSYIDAHRTSSQPYDVAVYGVLPDEEGKAADVLAGLAQAGATWLRVGPAMEEAPEDFLRWVRRGPPAR